MDVVNKNSNWECASQKRVDNTSCGSIGAVRRDHWITLPYHLAEGIGTHSRIAIVIIIPADIVG